MIECAQARGPSDGKAKRLDGGVRWQRFRVGGYLTSHHFAIYTDLIRARGNAFRALKPGVDMPALLLTLLLSALPHASAEQVFASVTLLEGSLKLIRGTTVYQGIEGMQLKRGDILETSSNSFAQLEFDSGGVVALGPVTRVYILPFRGSSDGHEPSLDLVILEGWLKSEAAVAKGLYRFRSVLLTVSTTGGTVVLRTSSTSCDIFLESGSSFSLSEASPSGETGAPTQPKAGQFFSRQRGAPVSFFARPTASFLDALPKQFRDTLPPRRSHLLDKPVDTKAEHAVSFDEIEPWLKLPSLWRRGLAERFSPRLSDANFRKQVERHVQEFPEWAPILYPKKASEAP